MIPHILQFIWDKYEWILKSFLCILSVRLYEYSFRFTIFTITVLFFGQSKRSSLFCIFTTRFYSFERVYLHWSIRWCNVTTFPSRLPNGLCQALEAICCSAVTWGSLTSGTWQGPIYGLYSGSVFLPNHNLCKITNGIEN